MPSSSDAVLVTQSHILCIQRGGKEDTFIQPSQFLVLHWEFQHQALCAGRVFTPAVIAAHCGFQVGTEENLARL